MLSASKQTLEKKQKITKEKIKITLKNTQLLKHFFLYYLSTMCNESHKRAKLGKNTSVMHSTHMYTTTLQLVTDKTYFNKQNKA